MSVGPRFSASALSRLPDAYVRRTGGAQRIVDQVDEAFDSFSKDYLEAQRVYVASEGQEQLFRVFTSQRITLLSQDLTRALSHVPGSLERLERKDQRKELGVDTPLQAFLIRRIVGRNGDGNDGSLSSILRSDTVIPPAGTTGPELSLYTLTATNAIESARTTTINAARFLVGGRFRK
ncbi:hypothetical protein [Tautonia plasticadhaerens]|nr:hypothetical protein [Tautonia plasticadhaerens]